LEVKTNVSTSHRFGQHNLVRGQWFRTQFRFWF